MSQPDIHLYTAGTMNGYKPVIFLEEAGVPYDLTHINFSKQEQKAPDYLALNPNGKDPDHRGPRKGARSSNPARSCGIWPRNTESFCHRTRSNGPR